MAEKVILRDYSLPCVLVDEEYNIVYFNGDTSPYLIAARRPADLQHPAHGPAGDPLSS